MTVRVVILGLGLCLLSVSASPAKIPEGTALEIRLKQKAGSLSNAGDRIEGEVVAPVVVDGRIVLPAGSLVAGTIKEAVKAAPPGKRARLVLDFTEIVPAGGMKTTLAAKVAEVDNARETVDKDGAILGILESEALTARMDRGLEKLAGGRLAKFAKVLQTAKSAVLQKADLEITCDSGVELELMLVKPLEWKDGFPAPKYGEISQEDQLYALVNSLPFQTTAEKPPKPSDITNLLFIGSRERLEAIFKKAGWSTAEQLNPQSGIETFRAVAENRGYKEAPMSVLLLDGQKPDFVFQKQHNTFAKRHHLRIFARPERFQGKEVWACAATHDIGISFSPENRTFIHLIDGKIDRERAKVVTDLLYSNLVKGVALVERPAVPTAGENATGDKIETDGSMAVLLLE